MDEPRDLADDPGCNNSKAPQCSVISTYRAMIAGAAHTVTVIWSKNLMYHSLSVSIDRFSGDGPSTCKVELKPWPFKSKKGVKSLDIDGESVDVSWNFRIAKFADGPEPIEGYYVALVAADEVVLLLGDRKKKAYKKTRSRPSLEEAVLVSKKENALGKRCFTARARLDGKGKEHEIMVENSIAEGKDAEMWISIDGIVLVHITNLQWKFRGNETVWVDQLPVQVLWDVHDWLFRGHGLGHALFMFKPGLPSPAAAAEEEQGVSGDDCTDQESASASASASARAMLIGSSSEFCYFLHAWKMD